MKDATTVPANDRVELEKVDNERWKATWYHSDKQHMFPIGSAVAVLRNVEILTNHGYNVFPSELYDELQKEYEAWLTKETYDGF